MEQNYPYRRLATPESIRLIQIRPELINGNILCEITTSTCSPLPLWEDGHSSPQQHWGSEEVETYEALSYFWGDSRPTRMIYLREKGHTQLYVQPLHENLWQFLNIVRRKHMFSGLFWTDSICLNQQDPDEIAHQVPRMGQIYSNAKRVLVWLGHDRRRACVLNTMYLDESFQYGLEHEVDHLLRLPYWNRAWILQEVALARKAVIMYGTFEVKLSKFYSIVSQFQDETVDRFNEPFWKLHRLRLEHGTWPLWRMLHEFSTCESTQAFDRVYSLFGLVSHSEEVRLYGISPIDLIRVDYKRPAFDLFFDTVLEMRAPWNMYRDIASSLATSLGIHQTDENFSSFADSALSGYLQNFNMLKTHFEFGKLALQVFHSMNMILSSKHNSECYQNALSTVTEQSRPNALQNAAWVGMMLTTPFNWWQDVDRREESRDVHAPDWGHSHCERKVNTLWRCARHQGRQAPLKRPKHHEPAAPCQPLLDVVLRGDKTQLRGLCGMQGASSDCNISIIILDVPGVNFRIIIKPDKELGSFRLLLCIDDCEDHYTSPISDDTPNIALTNYYFNGLNTLLEDLGLLGRTTSNTRKNLLDKWYT